MPSKRDVIDKLRKRGERLTIQRRLVIETLCDQDEHWTVQDIQQHIQQQGTHLTEPTIYRILQWLKELGMVSQTDLGRRGIVYQLIEEHLHHHLSCLICGAVIDMDDQAMEPLREYLRERFNFEPRIDHMAIFGWCSHCQSSGATP